jgi:allantoate deiminase
LKTPRSIDSKISAQLHARLAALAVVTEEPGRITRRFLSPAMLEANALLADWCRAAGMQPVVDAVGNLRARWRAIPDVEQPVLVLGSHLDTVRNAGPYDGPLGVIAALGCIEQLQAWGLTLPFDLEIVAFADEEGLRFQTAYLGSAYYVGAFEKKWLQLVDADGISLAKVSTDFGQDPDKVAADQQVPANLCGYLEMHIEQGPVLEKEACAAGVVSAIAAQIRGRLIFQGKAGHAGTTPMELRQDALCAAAEAVLQLEEAARGTAGLRATVGQIQIEPGASNVIPSLTRLSVDVRHADRVLLDRIFEKVLAQIEERAQQRRVTLRWELFQQSAGVDMDATLTAHLRTGAEEAQGRAPSIVSGAGHDGVMLARVCPVAMLFVRCRDGLSHHPDEYASPADIDQAFGIFANAIVRYAEAFSP